MSLDEHAAGHGSFVAELICHEGYAGMMIGQNILMPSLKPLKIQNKILGSWVQYHSLINVDNASVQIASPIQDLLRSPFKIAN